MKKSSVKSIVILLVMLVIVAAVLAYAIPQMKAAKAAANVEDVTAASVDRITFKDGQVYIPEGMTLEGTDADVLLIMAAQNSEAMDSITDVSKTAITEIARVGVNNGWANAVGSLADNAWIVMMIIFGLIFMYMKNKEGKANG